VARASHAEDPPFLEVLYSAVNPLDKRYAFLEMSILYSRQLEATDLRDRIYAPLSLASQFSQRGTDSGDWIHPDYSQDFTTTFINVSLLLLKNCPSLSLLSQVEDRRERILQQLPSWVPDFSVAKVTSPLRNQGQYDASRHGVISMIEVSINSLSQFCYIYHVYCITRTIITRAFSCCYS
jgi:hypothetical protein